MFGAKDQALAERLLQDAIWRARCDHSMLLDAGLQHRYPQAFHLDNASHLRPLPRNIEPGHDSMVYIGSLDSRVDFAWLRRLVARRVRLDIFGTVHLGNPATRQELDAFVAEHPNVRFLGGYDNDDLWRILQWYRVGVVPYHVDHPMTRHVNPDKIFHYLNAGMAVLSTPFPQALRHLPHIHLVETGGDWEQAMADLAERPRGADWSAEANNWDRRWSQLLQSVQR